MSGPDKTDSPYDPFSENRPLRILLLEDSDLDVELIRIKLHAEFDFIDEVVFEKNDFKNSLEQFNPDVILSDYSMPQFNGLDALRILKASSIQRPFIIVTGAIDEETAVMCIKEGADDYLLKDRLTRLPEAIKQSIRQKKISLDKELATKALEESVRNFSSLGKASPDYVFLITREGFIKYKNSNDLFDEELSDDSNIFDFLSPSYKERIKKGIEEAYINERNLPFTLKNMRKDKRQYYYRCKISRIFKEDNYAEFMFLLNDITDTEETKIDLEFSHLRLRDLLNRLEWVRDDEKKRISMEIHDQLGQELTASKLGLFYLRQQFDSKLDLKERDEKIITKINELIELSGNTLKTVRRIAHQLRPVILDDLGLIPALEWMIKNFNENTDILWQLNADIAELDFSDKFTTAAFRVMQETITNVLRHSEAKNCFVSIEKVDDRLLFRTKDDGKGFDLQIAGENGKLGLFGIEERIKPWEGKLEIITGANLGTEVIISFPLSLLK